MLREIEDTRQTRGERTKRWFTDEEMDLFIWFHKDGSIASFQLTYDKSTVEHALTWKGESRYTHDKVESGEARPGKYKSTPLLVPDGDIDKVVVAEKFKRKAEMIDVILAEFVESKILSL